MTCACKVLLQGDMRCELQVLQPVSTLWGAEFQGQVLKAAAEEILLVLSKCDLSHVAAFFLGLLYLSLACGLLP